VCSDRLFTRFLRGLVGVMCQGVGSWGTSNSHVYEQEAHVPAPRPS
jgi:hypothetical protein